MGMQARQGERGAGLVLVLAMLLALGFIGAALIFTAGGDLKVSGQDRRGTQAQSPPRPACRTRWRGSRCVRAPM